MKSIFQRSAYKKVQENLKAAEKEFSKVEWNLENLTKAIDKNKNLLDNPSLLSEAKLKSAQKVKVELGTKLNQLQQDKAEAQAKVDKAQAEFDKVVTELEEAEIAKLQKVSTNTEGAATKAKVNASSELSKTIKQDFDNAKAILKTDGVSIVYNASAAGRFGDFFTHQIGDTIYQFVKGKTTKVLPSHKAELDFMFGYTDKDPFGLYIANGRKELVAEEI